MGQISAEGPASRGARPRASHDPRPGRAGAVRPLAAVTLTLAPARPVRPPGPAAEDIDADVPGAVGRMLETVLRGRTDEATATDRTFARDIAHRVSRFTRTGGKRVRSQFLWWALRACCAGEDPARTDAALRTACALELIQTCALVHDDVMDGSPLRRGGPAVHSQLAAQYAGTVPPAAAGPFATAAAILAGDLALAWADDIVAAVDVPPGTRARMLGVWRAMRTEMVAGQYLDLHGQATGARSTARAIRAACLKSALYTVERPLVLGAALAGADEAVTAALSRAGRRAGIAFQLRDDLHGVFGDPRRTGKPSGDDLRDGKPTYLVAVARRRAEAGGDRHAPRVLDRVLGDPRATDADLDRVREILESTGARAMAEVTVERLVVLADRHLATAALDPAARVRLRALFHSAAEVPETVGATTPGSSR